MRSSPDSYAIKLARSFSGGILKVWERHLRILVTFLTFASFVALITAVQPSDAQKTPWKRRLRKGVVLNDSPEARPDGPKGPLTALEMRRLGLRPRGGGLVDLSYWPKEPASPGHVTPTDLAQAMAHLCPSSVDGEQLEHYADAIVRYGTQFAVDPWLLAALVYTQSDCHSNVDNSYGTGLTLINVGMHQGHIRDGVYHFAVRSAQGWSRKTVEVSAFPFRREVLTRPEPNLYFAAAFLHVFEEQCPDIDHAFDSVPHRNAVSHFVWGDHVKDAGPEDRILTARRRLLSSYARLSRDGRGLVGISFVSPLDGYPRVAISGLGEPRDNGRRIHRGIDLASEEGEPVRSVAAGTVTFAGVDWERRAQIPLEPWGARIIHKKHMGPRGLFVKIDHGHGVMSLYAHLSSYDVEVGDRVKADQRIGEVGRTGIKESAPHLHFGLFQNGKTLDPLDYLAAYVFPPILTKRGRPELAKKHHDKPRQHRH